jgi:hypothetical protein
MFPRKPSDGGADLVQAIAPEVTINAAGKEDCDSDEHFKTQYT